MLMSELYNAFALGDWDGDGQVDAVLVTERDVRHYRQEDDLGFLEAESPLSRIRSTSVLGAPSCFVI